MINKLLCGVTLMLAGACFTACNDSVIDDNTDGVLVQMCASIASRNAVESRVAYWEYPEFLKDHKINVDAWHFRDLNGVRKTETRFFDSQEMTYDGSSSWIYSPVKYWPNVVDEKLAVCAYLLCPTTTDSGKCTITKDSQSGYSMTFKGCGIPDDIVVAPLTEVSRSQLEEGKIPLTFYHIFSQIKVRARYIPNNGDNESFLTIKRMVYSYYSEAGTFTGFADVGGVPTAQWSDAVGMNGNIIYGNPDITIEANKDYVDLDFTLCQIPFESPNYDVVGARLRHTYLDFYVTFDGETDYPPVYDASGKELNAINYYKDLEFSLQAGKTTTFDVTFNGKDIVVDVSVDGNPDWSGAGGTINAGF